jgi:hypothetical protein
MSKKAAWRIGVILTGSVAAGCLAALASGAEAPAGPPPKRPSFVARLDKNGDHKVSAAEFDGPAEHFKAMDKDRDGFLTEAEAPKGPPPPRPGQPGVQPKVQRRVAPDSVPDQRGKKPPHPTRAEDQARFIARLDQDGDGKVSADEFDGPPEHFEEADANGDGYLETAEVPPPPCPPPGGEN